MDLKYYAEYRAALHKYAKGIGIKIQYTHSDSEGIYLPAQNLIKLDREMEDHEVIGTLLHELGHVMDDVFASKKGFTRLDAAYKAVYAKKYTAKQHRLVLDCEKRAWKNGKAIAKQLKIPLGKWYTKMTRMYLGSYANRDKRVK